MSRFYGSLCIIEHAADVACDFVL